MSETYPEQIARMRTYLQRAADGDYNIEDNEISDLLTQGQDQTLQQRLTALDVAILNNIANTVHNNQNQIGLALDFARHVTFYAQNITSDLSFWTDEINDDIEQNKFLFQRAHDGINYLRADPQREAAVDKTAAEDLQTGSLARKQQKLLHEFSLRNKRRAEGQTMYEENEYPEDPGKNPDAGSAENKMKQIRQQQMETALEDVGILLDRALLSLKRMHFISTSILPEFEKLPATLEEDKNLSAEKSNWQNDINISFKNGIQALDDAGTMLTFHAARHSAFERRLERAKNAPSPLNG